MTPSNPKLIEFAKEINASLASPRLSLTQAKLYSQHSRLSSGQDSLPSWSELESKNRLNEALVLIEASFLLISEHNLDLGYTGLKRAAEILEWLSHPEISQQAPFRLLSAALYQIAGYPARAAGLLKEPVDNQEWNILAALLKSNYTELQTLLTNFWSSKPPYVVAYEICTTSLELQQILLHQLCNALGIVNSSMRWGLNSKTDLAIEKLYEISKIFLHSKDTFSWLLAHLLFHASERQIKSSLRLGLQDLMEGLTEDGIEAFEKYCRLNFISNRVLVWNSQVKGIKNLKSENSFVLCTPTGSGKTSIAEIAIIQSLFKNHGSEELTENGLAAPLALYLVPSRALAAEVESKLSRVFKNLFDNKIVVTGLYGGIDWGPTEAWTTSNQKTILICTFEKAEALVRFLGKDFLNRVSLVIVDEAHGVEFSGTQESLLKSENRSLRLESILMRLLTHKSIAECRFIALSAVASNSKTTLARWISKDSNNQAQISTYRSTRQIIGRLECLPGRKSEIKYDVLDDTSLNFESDSNSSPYIPSPFKPHPSAPTFENLGPEKTFRPYLFWAAFQLASKVGITQKAVLIMTPQNIYGYAKDALTLLNLWQEHLPNFFTQPTDEKKLDIYTKCLESCIDYFGQDSLEYLLLSKGVILHHGKMPGLLARLLTQAIDERVVHLVLATSTLSEGINLPFETVLIPSLLRYGKTIPLSEFKNLTGRAGRPGTGTEGKTLVLVGSPDVFDNAEKKKKVRLARKRYESLIDKLVNSDEDHQSVRSPLAELIKHLENSWRKINQQGSREEFLQWLEVANPLEHYDESDDPDKKPIQTLDSLDNILLSGIVELENFEHDDINPSELEEKISMLWRNSFAHYAETEENRLKETYLIRAKAVVNSIHPSKQQRRRLYRTGLPPKSGNELIRSFQTIKELLQEGSNYTQWTIDQQSNYIIHIATLINELEHFKFASPDEAGTTWQKIFKWWIDPQSNPVPSVDQRSKWIDYISKNFIYKFNWGIGSVIAVTAEETIGVSAESLTINDWERLSLPWIAFWLKEIITWGTTDPVASYILSKGIRYSRNSAKMVATNYYQEANLNSIADPLKPFIIQDWVNLRFNTSVYPKMIRLPSTIRVELLRDLSSHTDERLRVMPVLQSNNIIWADPTGFALASSMIPETWEADYFSKIDFFLEPIEKEIVWELYV